MQNKNSNTQEPESDLLLVGHAVEDWIFEDGKEPVQKWGGIFNVARSFKAIDGLREGRKELIIKIEPSAYGHAFIKIDRTHASKDVTASLNNRLREPRISPSKWTHYCYLNELKNFRSPKKGHGLLSADLCEGMELYETSGEEFDYIFLSRDEHNPEELSRYNNRTIFISHSPQKVEMWNHGKIRWKYDSIEQLENVSVLGVGDHFASSFIYAKLFFKKYDEAAIRFAIQSCREYLLSN